MLPVLLDKFGITLHSYPLFIGLAIGVAYSYIRGQLEVGSSSVKHFQWFFWGTILSAWLGAKLLFLLVSAGKNQALYLSSSSFWLGGGLVFYGGLIFGILFVWIYSSIFKLFPKHELYKLIPALPLAHAIGRIGCFLAGCCYGSQCNLPWSVFMHGKFRHPTQLYESVLLAGLFLILHKLASKKSLNYLILPIYLLLYGVMRFLLEFFRGDKVRGTYFLSISTSQIIALLMICFSISLIYRCLKKMNN